MSDKTRRLIDAKSKTLLPQGLTEFHTWSDDIIDLYDLPNNDTVKFALATAILHAAPDAAVESKEWYGLRMQKGASNEIAAAVMHEIKDRNKLEVAKRLAAEQAAAKIASDAAKE